MEQSSPRGPLDGVRVVDLTMWIQGPAASMLLADMGAEVIKVERAGAGDPSRNIQSSFGVQLAREGAENLLFAMFNRNKRVLALDLKQPASMAVLQRLVAGADIFVTNLQGAALSALGVDYDAVRAMNARIVYAQGLGLGADGPFANDPCMDTVGMAYSGFMFTASPDPAEPNYPPGALSDVMSGTMLTLGILAALARRNLTGEAQYVTASQLQAMLWLQSMNIGVYANTGLVMTPPDRTKAHIATFNTYRCADGNWIALGIGVVQEYQWPGFCKVIERPDLLDDPKYAALDARLANAHELIRLFDGHFATRPAAHWLDALRAEGLWVSAVNHIEALADDPQVVANDYIRTTSDGFRHAGPPFTITGYEPPAGPAPAYGADSDLILAELGFGEDEVIALRASGAVW